MVDNSTHPHHTSSEHGNNIPNTSLTHIPKIDGSSQLSPKLTCEVTYENIQAIRPITHWFSKAIGLIPGAQNLPHFMNRQETTPTDIVVSTMEYLAFSTLEELEESADDMEHP